MTRRTRQPQADVVACDAHSSARREAERSGWSVEGFLNLSIAVDEKVANLAAAIQYYFKNGQEDSNNKGHDVGRGLAP